MSAYSDMWQVIKMRVCQNSNVPEAVTYGTNNYVGSRVKLRILQIFTLECILDQYRKKNGSPFAPLEEERALYHMIFEKTKWPLQTIRDLHLNDALFIINDQLKISNLPQEAQTFISKLNLGSVAYSVDDFPKEDWAPKENAIFLQVHEH
jgi:hypothetical protein